MLISSQVERHLRCGQRGWVPPAVASILCLFPVIIIIIIIRSSFPQLKAEDLRQPDPAGATCIFFAEMLQLI